MIRVFIVDDHPLICDSLQTIIDLQSDMEVVGRAENGQDAYDAIGSLKPDVVLMDIQMPVMNGIECAERIKRDYPHTVVIILTTFPEDEYIIEGLLKGASGFLVKSLSGSKIVEAIRDAMKGELMLPAEVAAKLAARLAQTTNLPTPAFSDDGILDRTIEFTEREKQIISLMIEGKTNREISKMLFISEGTVKNYNTVIYQKIGENNRTKAVLLLKELLKNT